MTLVQRHFHVWSGCDERMAKAAIALKESFDELKEKGSRHPPLKRLIREHLDPAFEAIASEFVTAGTFFIRRTFGRDGISGWHKNLVRLDREICIFAKERGSRILRSIDTLRAILAYIRPTSPTRMTSKAEKTLKGALRRRLPQCRTSTTQAWPYCELCYRPSEAATHRIFAASSAVQANDSSIFLSARYCTLHSPRTGRAYDRDFHRRDHFNAVLDATLKETRRERRFQARFRGLAPADALVNPFDQGNRMNRPSLDLDGFSDYESNIRHYAYLVAQQNTLSCTTTIALLRASGSSDSQIARELKMSPSAVAQRVKKSDGCFDFSRSDPLLFWWPDSILRGRATFKLTSPGPATAPIAQLARRAMKRLTQSRPLCGVHRGDQKLAADRLLAQI